MSDPVPELQKKVEVLRPQAWQHIQVRGGASEQQQQWLQQQERHEGGHEKVQEADQGDARGGQGLKSRTLLQDAVTVGQDDAVPLHWQPLVAHVYGTTRVRESVPIVFLGQDIGERRKA
jgi:hypothetical protein